MSRSFKLRGFGLIEVLVTIAVLAVGLTALLAFQGRLLQSGGDAKARAMAVALAEAKLEDLRTFTQTAADTNGTGVFGFMDIGDNTGGSWNADGTLRIPSGMARDLGGESNIAGVEFTRNWTVQDYYFPPESAVGPGAAAVAAADWTWGTLPLMPDYKEVRVRVDWTNASGGSADDQQVETVGVMNLADPSITGKAASPPMSSQGPLVQYSPGQRPDIIPVPMEVGDGRTQEASKPEPTVIARSGTTITRLDEVMYASDFTTKYRNAFLTLNCVCQKGRSDGQRGRAPTVLVNRQEWVNAGRQWVSGLKDWMGDADIDRSTQSDRGGAWALGPEVVGKAVGHMASGNVSVGGNTFNLSQQPEICDPCCRDHHDVSATTYPPYDPLRPGTDHTHYFPNNLGVLEEATASDGLYLESCRMIRLDGFWRVAQDWALLKVNVIPADYLTTDAGVAAYQNYVVNYLANYVDAAAASYPPTAVPEPTTPWPDGSSLPILMSVGQTQQFLARAIYIDHMGLRVRNTAKAEKDASGDYLARIPFHEINLTKLGHWSSTLDTAITVTSEPISDAYSRGLVAAEQRCPSYASAGTAALLGNCGLTDTRAIDPGDASEATDSVHLSVMGVAGCLDDGDDQAVTVIIKGNVSIAAGAVDVSPSDLVFGGARAGDSCQRPNRNSCGDEGLDADCYVCAVHVPREDLTTSISIGNYNKTVTCGQGQDRVEILLNNSVTPAGEVLDDSLVSETTHYRESWASADEAPPSIVRDLVVDGTGCP